MIKRIPLEPDHKRILIEKLADRHLLLGFPERIVLLRFPLGKGTRFNESSTVGFLQYENPRSNAEAIRTFHGTTWTKADGSNVNLVFQDNTEFISKKRDLYQ